MSNIPARLPYNWIPDKRCTICHLCQSQFTMLNRKHHCRSCGKIFCSNCCFKYQSLPSYLPHTHNRFLSNAKVKVCNICYSDIVYIKHSKNLILTMSLIPVTIKELVECRCVCKRWKIAVDSVISVFKAIQYKTSYQTWSGLERRLLLTHWREFNGHSRLMTSSFRGLCGVVDLSDLVRHYKCGNTHTDCIYLFCNKTCSNELTPYDIFELFCGFPSDDILRCQEMESWIGILLTRLEKKWVHIFIPWIIQGCTPEKQRIIANNIIPYIHKDIDMVYKFYFECRMIIQSTHRNKTYYLSLLDRLKSIIDDDMKKYLEDTEKLVHHFMNPDHINEYYFKDMRMPFDPSIVIEDVQVVNIKRLNTHTKPWVIPVDTNKGLMHILVKNDDVRKDRFVTDVMRILISMTEEITFKMYHVLPVTPESGIIQMIPNSITLYDINQTTTLTNYIIRENINMPMSHIRDVFVKSCASNCVLGYMLGIGDRNLGNILVTKDGYMTHIDFSYILGTDPKLMEELTEMRITPGMVNMLGGKQSKEFNELKTKCSSVYSNLKPYTFFWYTLFEHLSTAKPAIDPHYGNTQDIQIHIEKRLMPEATKEEIEMTIIDIVDKNSDSYVAGWIDSFHHLKSSVEDIIFKINL